MTQLFYKQCTKHNYSIVIEEVREVNFFVLSFSLQDAYIQSRADTMQNIESTIVELGSIFQQLAHMVKEQEEIVGRYDTCDIGPVLMGIFYHSFVNIP